MIFQSFLLGNLVSLCMKIINSVVVVGLYYGFLTTFSIGPSYLFLLRAQVMEEGTEKKVSATTGFITGQLMMFISIYYAPLHLALGRPHTITVLALPYLLFHFFWNNHKHFFDYGSTTRNLMRNLSIQCVFLNNLIFQLFNYFILPSSMLARLVNIYMFRCNNKMLFVTSSFVGWLIGHILFMKWLGLVLVWIRQNHSIRSNVLIRSNKYLVSELRNSMARIFSILLFITCVYYLGRIPSPILTKKLKETSKTEERVESEEERDVEIETTSEMKGIKQEQEGSTEEDPSSSLFSEEKEDPDKIDETEEIRVNGKEKTKDEFDFHFTHFTETGYNKSPVYDSYLNRNGNQENSNKKGKLFLLEKSLVTLLFDYNRWNRPLRYIKNNRFEKAVRNEMSQYFFDTCQSNGKQKVSFTYPPSLSIFGKILKRKISWSAIAKAPFDNHWIYASNIKENNISKEFRNRIEALDKGSLFLDILETRTRLYNDDIKNEYFPKMYDPFLTGTYRVTMKIRLLPYKTSIENLRKIFGINRLYAILFPDPDYQEFEQKTNTFDKNDKKQFFIEMENFLLLTSEFDRELKLNKDFSNLSSFLDQEQGKMDFEKEKGFEKSLFNVIGTHTNGQKESIKESIGIKEISKKVPRRSYKLITDLEQQSGEYQENVPTEHQIRSRKAKRVVIFTDNKDNTDSNTNDTNPTDPRNEVALLRYSQQADFRRGIIKGSMRAQRRKILIWELFQANVHSPLFLDRIKRPHRLSFDISEIIKGIFTNWTGKGVESKIVEYIDEKTKKEEKKEKDKKEENIRKEQTRIEIAEAWDTIPLAQIIRGSMLITQSILRKYILLPSLIITKNIGRMLLLQLPEWFEDIREWNQEMHVKCTYNGVQLSETEFPKNWLTDGIQIKILFPFCLKPWHKSKLRSSNRNLMKKKKQKNDFCFLTVWGMETELPFGSPRKRYSFFEPVFKELETKIGKLKRAYLLALRALKGKTKLVSKETKTRVIETFLFLKRIIKRLSKLNPILLFSLRKVSESNEIKNEKDSRISNQKIPESFSLIQSPIWTNSSLTEKKKKDLIDRTSTIQNQIEKITKEKKKITPGIYISPTKKSYNAKRFKSPTNIWQILKRRNARLISQLDCFINIFVERIYINIFLSILNIPRLNTQIFLESIKKIMDKPINEANQERLNRKNENQIHFISTISTLKGSIDSIRNTTNSHSFCDLSYLSQAYVFYKLSQIQASNLYKLRSVFQYHGMSFFIKTEIKDSFETQGIIHSKLSHKKLPNYEMNEWKNWLKGHYQYDLSQIRWSGLIPQRWRNRVNLRRITKNPNFKWDSYEKIQSKKKKDSEVYYLLNQKENFQKNSRYDFLSYKSINLNYENKGDSSIYRSSFQVQVKKNEDISYNSNTHKHNFFDICGSIPINNYGDLRYMEKNPDRKYFDWKILNFDLRQKITIESWIKIDTKSNQNTKINTNNYQIIDKKDLVYFTLPQNLKINSPNPPKFVLDWMGMNEEILSRPISTLGLWFLPEFVLLYNLYKPKPWVIPSKVLLLNLNRNQNAVSENKNIEGNQKGECVSNKKIKNQNRNQKEKEPVESKRYLRSNVQKQENPESGPSTNHEKDIEDPDAKSKRKEGKKYKSHTGAELDFFLKRYLLFQLRWGDALNQRMINNIQIYCLLLRLINPRKITISSIQRREMSLDIMLIQKNLSLAELIKRGVLVIEPTRLSVKNDGQFIMYQTLGISLVHKSKHQINQGYREQTYVDKNNLDLLVPENILSHRRRRELRIRISFNSKNRNKNRILCTEKNGSQSLDKKNLLDKDKNELIKLKFFLWPNYRLEDLACMNRYWFDTTNGSRFSMLRIHLYPPIEKSLIAHFSYICYTLEGI
uniref:hypothetical protein RF1 n=1 Tax=Tabernaemontana bovina TaxID=3036760 RepID=UPI002551CF9A|nr:hypothetical protein RF1 [Tabernaemontana bovina]WEV93215.1 hypothetical protein RF1 [Tabernaemontana bovina]